MEEVPEKILYVLTCAAENPERATLPWVLGNAALAMDVGATVVLQGNGVYLAQKGYTDHMVSAHGFSPVKKLMTDFQALGGRILVCVPCIRERNISETDLIEGTEPAAAAKVNTEAMESKAVFVY